MKYVIRMSLSVVYTAVPQEAIMSTYKTPVFHFLREYEKKVPHKDHKLQLWKALLSVVEQVVLLTMLRLWLKFSAQNTHLGFVDRTTYFSSRNGIKLRTVSSSGWHFENIVV